VPRRVTEPGVEHERDQLGLARDIAVQRHLGAAQPLGQVLHRQVRQPFGVRQRDRLGHDPLQ